MTATAHEKAKDQTIIKQIFSAGRRINRVVVLLLLAAVLL